MHSILCARLLKQKEIRKQDQNGILAQNILLCGKLRLEFSAKPYSEPERMVLSSGAMVTAAETVQRTGKHHKPRRTRRSTKGFVGRVFLRATSCPWWLS